MNSPLFIGITGVIIVGLFYTYLSKNKIELSENNYFSTIEGIPRSNKSYGYDFTADVR
jgi:hypothetical protein